MAENIVESIIVKLGLDGSQYNREADKAVKQNDKLNKSVGETDKAVGAVTKTLARWFSVLTVATGVKKMIDEVQQLNNELFFLEKNLGMSAQSIKNWQGAAGAMGGSAQGMTESMKSLNMGMNDFVMMGDTSLLPFMNTLGVSMVDAQGKLRDTDKVMLDLADSFSKMDREQAFSIASKMGIDEGTFNTLVQGRKEMEKMLEYQAKMYKSSEEELQASRELAKNRALLGRHWESLKTMMANAIIPLFVKLSEVALGIFEYLQENQEAVQAVFKGIAFTVGVILIPILTKAMIAALAFIAPFAPFIITVGLLGAAFGLLYDDYKAWAEGGKSLFDWGVFTKFIDTARDSVKSLKDAFGEAKKAYLDMAISLNEKIGETETGAAFLERVGSLTAKTMAFFGNKEAREAVKQNEGIDIKPVFGGSESTTTTQAPIEQSSTNAGAGSNIVKLLGIKGTERKYLLASGQTETRTGGTVAWRNNNPGNLKFGFRGSADTKANQLNRSREKALADAQKRYKGVIDLDQWGNAIFESMEAGAIAKAQLLRKSFGNKTMPEMLRSYAKDDYSGKTNYKGYEQTINNVAKSKGVNLSGKKINQMTQAEFAALAEGMVVAEGVKVGKSTLSGQARPTVAAQSAMRQGDFIDMSRVQANQSAANKANSVQVNVGDINIQTSSSTVTGNIKDASNAIKDNFYQLQPSIRY